MKEQKNEEILNTVKRIFTDITGLSDEDITEETVLSARSGLNSFMIIQLASAAEDEFNIKITNSSLRKFKTVGDIVKYIGNVRE